MLTLDVPDTEIEQGQVFVHSRLARRQVFGLEERLERLVVCKYDDFSPEQFALELLESLVYC